MAKKKTQSQKFKELARKAECEDDEKKFDERLKRITGVKKKSGSKKAPAAKAPKE